MGTMHLWWNGYDHAPGRTAEEARLWMLQECGVDVPADEWEEMSDDEYMRDEDESISIPSETAAQLAAAMIAESPLRAVLGGRHE